MDSIVIEGGTVLEGEVEVSGAKNAALPLLFGTLLTPERCVLRHVPALADISTAPTSRRPRTATRWRSRRARSAAPRRRTSW